MRRLAYLAAGGLVVLALAAALIRTTVSTEAVRQAAIQEIEALTGFETEVHGATSLSFFPDLRFKVRDVVLERSRGRRENEVAAIHALRGRVALLPLLVGDVVIEDLALVRPYVVLGVDRAGRPDWLPMGGAFGRALAGERLAPEAAAARIGTIRIEDGVLVHADLRSGTRTTVSAINATLSWPTIGSALKASGSLVWNGEVVNLALDAAAPVAFLRRGETRVRLTVDSASVKAGFDGRASRSAGLQLDGALAAASPSVRGALRWLGIDTGSGPGLAELKLTGTLNLIGGSSAALTGLDLTLDGNRAEGGLKLSFAGDDVALQGTLAFGALDLDQYRAGPRAGAGEAPTLMDRRIDLSPIARLSADLRISAGSVRIGGLELGRTAGTISGRNGALDIGIGEAGLYGGTGLGSLAIGLAPRGVAVRLSMKLDGTDMARLLGVTAGIDRISGLGSASVSLSGSGRTLSEIVAGLSGEARIAIARGALNGLDVARLADALDTGRVEGWPVAAGAKTEFETVGARFRVAKGIASTESFSLVGPSLAVAAEGEIRLLPMSIAGHGVAELGAADGSAEPLPVPFVIEGPIGRPSIYPDPLWLLNRAAVTPEDVDRFMRDLAQETPETVVERILRHGLGRGPDVRTPQTGLSAPQQ